jgi:hypothetical protein
MNTSVQATPENAIMVVHFLFFFPYLAMTAAGILHMARTRKTTATTTLGSYMVSTDVLKGYNNFVRGFLSNIPKIVRGWFRACTLDLLDLVGDLFHLLGLCLKFRKIHRNAKNLGQHGKNALCTFWVNEVA